MNKFHWLWICLTVVLACVFGTSNAMPRKPPPIPVSMIWLLVTPQAYAGKDVSVGGYLSLEMEDNRLYLNCASYRYREQQNSIGIAALGTSNFFRFRSDQGSYVKVSGRFEPNPHYGRSPMNGSTAGWIDADASSKGVAEISEPQPRVGVAKKDLCAGSKTVEIGRSPKVIIRVDLKPTNREKFISALRDFAKQHGFKMTKRHIFPNGGSNGSVNKILTRNDGVTIGVLGDRGTTADARSNVYVYIFVRHKNADWPSVAKHLLSKMRDEWPRATETKYWEDDQRTERGAGPLEDSKGDSH